MASRPAGRKFENKQEATAWRTPQDPYLGSIPFGVSAAAIFQSNCLGFCAGNI
ncbi:hypothetical protein M5D96_001594 [Drosophila gunungcola]|uniref:Uncharacterized protein n=1 Tax=Drosophila gunungcola TaxID=103775 RepID=A0A9P9YZ79_9MUSC|nr:hypothetical protein M5D96_001594 [Drosophila gunungcola]